MKMKKLLCIALAACLVLTFAACSGGSQDEAEGDTPKSEQTGSAGSNIPLKDNTEEAENQVRIAMESLLEETYGDKIDDFRINDVKIYTAEEEQETEVLNSYDLGPDEVAFEVHYDLHPAEGTDINELLPANGEYDEESGWIVNKFNLGILRSADDGSYTITDYGTGW